MEGIVGILHWLSPPNWLVVDKDLSCFYLTLPIPPSTNNLFKTVVVTDRSGRFAGTRRAKTRDYEDWITAAGFGASWPRGYEGMKPAILLYIDCGQMKKNRDVDNCIKPVQDLMAAMMGVDDSLIAWTCSFRSEDHGVAAGTVGVTIIVVE